MNFCTSLEKLYCIFSFSSCSILCYCIYGCMYSYFYVMKSSVCLIILNVIYFTFCVSCFIVLFYVLFVCKYLPYYCQIVSTLLHLNISYHTSLQICLFTAHGDRECKVLRILFSRRQKDSRCKSLCMLESILIFTDPLT